MLTIYQKSLYLIILNATMITRSIGKTLKNSKSRKTLKHYKKRLFKKLIFLSKKLENGTLTENAIIKAIEDLASGLDKNTNSRAIPLYICLTVCSA